MEDVLVVPAGKDVNSMEPSKAHKARHSKVPNTERALSATRAER